MTKLCTTALSVLVLFVGISIGFHSESKGMNPEDPVHRRDGSRGKPVRRPRRVQASDAIGSNAISSRKIEYAQLFNQMSGKQRHFQVEGNVRPEQFFEATYGDGIRIVLLKFREGFREIDFNTRELIHPMDTLRKILTATGVEFPPRALTSELANLLERSNLALDDGRTVGGAPDRSTKDVRFLEYSAD